MAWVPGELNQDTSQTTQTLNNYTAVNATGNLYFMKS